MAAEPQSVRAAAHLITMLLEQTDHGIERVNAQE
jgi:hypothetical protein